MAHLAEYFSGFKHPKQCHSKQTMPPLTQRRSISDVPVDSPAPPLFPKTAPFTELKVSLSFSHL